MEVTRSASAVDIAEYHRYKGIIERYEQAEVVVRTQIAQHSDHIVKRGHFRGMLVADLLTLPDSKSRYAFKVMVGRYLAYQERPDWYDEYDFMKQLDYISFDIENVYPWEVEQLAINLNHANVEYKQAQLHVEWILERVRTREMTQQMAELSLDPSLAESMSDLTIKH